jgi:argininosuccinate lyase
MVMKGLPLTYQKDMQEDKEQTFDAFESLSLSIAAMTGMIRDLEPNVEVMKKAAGSGYSTATDLADWLVRVLGLPFREAHHVTGRLVGMASAKGIGLEKLTLEEMTGVHSGITADVFGVLSVTKSVASRVSHGGTAPANVRKQAKRWLKKLSVA